MLKKGSSHTIFAQHHNLLHHTNISVPLDLQGYFQTIHTTTILDTVILHPISKIIQTKEPTIPLFLFPHKTDVNSQVVVNLNKVGYNCWQKSSISDVSCVSGLFFKIACTWWNEDFIRASSKYHKCKRPQMETLLNSPTLLVSRLYGMLWISRYSSKETFFLSVCSEKFSVLESEPFFYHQSCIAQQPEEHQDTVQLALHLYVRVRSIIPLLSYSDTQWTLGGEARSVWGCYEDMKCGVFVATTKVINE